MYSIAKAFATVADGKTLTRPSTLAKQSPHCAPTEYGAHESAVFERHGPQDSKVPFTSRKRPSIGLPRSSVDSCSHHARVQSRKIGSILTGNNGKAAGYARRRSLFHSQSMERELVGHVLHFPGERYIRPTMWPGTPPIPCDPPVGRSPRRPSIEIGVPKSCGNRVSIRPACVVNRRSCREGAIMFPAYPAPFCHTSCPSSTLSRGSMFTRTISEQLPRASTITCLTWCLSTSIRQC